MAVFGAPTGAEKVNLQSGSPEYQQAIMGQAQRQLAPVYRNAMRQQRSNLQSRGLSDSGIAIGAEQALSQDFAGQLSDIAARAATGGADLAERNRQRLEERGWQVQDRDLALQAEKDAMDRRERMAGSQIWADLIGGAAGAAGSLAGGPLYGLLAGPAAGAAGGAGAAMASQAAKPKPYGVAGLGSTSVGRMDPTLAAYLD
jgi:hypothetical protein